MNIILSIIISVILIYIGYIIGSLVKDQEWIQKLPKIKKESLDKSRSVIKGQTTEQLAPYLPNFPYNASECKFLGKPFDFLVIKGLDNKEPEEIIFVEVKTGESKLSSIEKKLKQIIDDKKVKYKGYRI